MIAPRRLTLNYRPHDAQRPFHASPARIRCIVSGRRFGKTTAASAEVLKVLLAAPRRRGWMVAPVYDQVMECWRKVMEILPPELVASATRSAHRIELVNGSLLEMRSGDNPEHLRGAGLDVLAIDEAARVSEESWWALYPATSVERGRIILTSTPHGRNWFWEVFQRGADGSDPDYAAWRFRSIENPHFTDGEWAFARRALPADWFAQEYEAQFLANEARVFRGLELCLEPAEGLDRGHGPEAGLPGTCTGSPERSEGSGACPRKRGQGEPRSRFSVGVDLGKLQDYTAICVLDPAARRLVHFERMRGLDWPTQRRRIAELARRWPGELWREGLRPSGFVMTADSKEQLIGHLALGLESRDLVIPRCPQTEPLVEELAAYEYRLTPGGRVSYGAPAGAHDDSAVALALAYWGLRHTSAATRI